MPVLARIVLLLTVACSSKPEPEAKPADPWASSPGAAPAQPAQPDPWGSNTAAEPTAAPAAPAATPIDGPLVNTWGSGRSNWSNQPGVLMGSFKYLYRFAADGTYTFHSESHTMTQGSRWYIVDEVGTIEVAGDRVTLRPTHGTGVTKNRDGSIIVTTDHPLETVTYQWQLHFFEGLGENQLVLTPVEPARMTTRDGSFAVNDQFASSYLLSASYKPEWKFQ